MKNLFKIWTLAAVVMFSISSCSSCVSKNKGESEGKVDTNKTTIDTTKASIDTNKKNGD